MSSTPLVSIITPTYNHEKYIAECIRSVLSQTYQNWEMIIIDDSSTDKTSEVIKSFSNSRIKYFKQNHLGAYQLGNTYNKALKEANGEFIAILEGDDFWDSNKLEIQMPYFSDKEVILTHGDCIITNEFGKRLIYRRTTENKSIRDNKPVGSTLKAFIKPQNYIHSPTVIIRKKILQEIGGFIQPDYLPLVDYPTWSRLALEGKFKGIHYPLGYWRRNIKSITLSNPLIISDVFGRYIREFIQQNQKQMKNLGFNINLAELEKQHYAQSQFAQKHQNYSKGLVTLMYGYNKAARKSFLSYLRQKNKIIPYAIISLFGILLSYMQLIDIMLPYVSYYFSGVFVLLKKYFFKNIEPR